MMKYRKALIAIILLLNFPLLTFAQKGEKWSILVHGDISMTNMTGKNSKYNTGVYNRYNGFQITDYNIKSFGGERLQSGWTGGMNVQYTYTDHFLFQAGINYSAKGGISKLNWVELDESLLPPFPVKGAFHFRLNYLVIPVSIGYKFNRLKHFYPSAGLYYGYLLSTFAQGRYIEMGEHYHFKEDVMKDYLRNDIGLSIGINYQIPLKTLNHFIADFKYSHSLFSIGSTKINPGPDMYNQMFSLGLAYEFTL